MIEAILAAIVALLQAIPIVNKWFTKTPLELENQQKAIVEKEHEQNSHSGEVKRPSGDFWKDRGGM